jgi:hypothetical protein
MASSLTPLHYILFFFLYSVAASIEPLRFLTTFLTLVSSYIVFLVGIHLLKEEFAKPIESESTDCTESTGHTEPTEHSECTECTQCTEPTESTGSTESSGSTEATDFTERSASPWPTKLTQSTERSECAGPIEPTVPTETIEAAESFFESAKRFIAWAESLGPAASTECIEAIDSFLASAGSFAVSSESSGSIDPRASSEGTEPAESFVVSAESFAAFVRSFGVWGESVESTEAEEATGPKSTDCPVPTAIEAAELFSASTDSCTLSADSTLATEATESTMESKATEALSVLKNANVSIESKVACLTGLKSEIKQRNVAEEAIPPIFETLRLAIAVQHSSLSAAGFSALGHLLKRLYIQEDHHAVALWARQLYPLLSERLGDNKERLRAQAAQAFTDLWPAAPTEVEHHVLEVALVGKNPRAKEMSLFWLANVSNPRPAPPQLVTFLPML